MDQVQIPAFSDNFQEKIDSLIKSAHQKLQHSKALYAKAEHLLLAELGLHDWQPSEEQIAVKSFKESFLQTGRLDAEYYQPRYDYALQKLKELQPVKIVAFEELLAGITNGHTPLRHDLSVGDVRFLTAEHVTDFQINFDSDKRILTEHHIGELARTQLIAGDLLLTIKGRIGNAAVIDAVPFTANINQDVALLRLLPNMNAYYIAGYINSILGKSFVNQICTGQINPFLGLGNLRTIPVPIFDDATMNRLGNDLEQKVYQAKQTQASSKRLLDVAKRGVEMAIEQDEVTAMQWMEAQARN